MTGGMSRENACREHGEHYQKLLVSALDVQKEKQQ
jgi:hypothetical protein